MDTSIVQDFKSIFSEMHGEHNMATPESNAKAAETRKNATYAIDEHINKVNADLTELLNEIREYIVSLDSSIEETPNQTISSKFRILRIPIGEIFLTYVSA